MPDWSEQALKSAASWKAFKEGKSLLDAGMVAQSKATPDGWTGSVRQGSKLIRLGVKVPKPGDFQVKCSCPENQASGAVCAHAVATGLALLGAASPAPTTKPAPVASISPSPKSGPLVPLIVRLAPNWSETFARGRLTVTLAPDPSVTPDPADAFLTAWVTRQGIPAIKGPLPLSLDGDRLAGFLEAALDHPRVFAGKEPLSITSDATLPLSEPIREGDLVTLCAPTAPFILGTHAWHVTSEAISRIGPHAIPDDLLSAFTTWATGKPARIPLKQLLRRAPVWEDWLALPEDSWLGDLRMVPAVPAFHLALEGSLSRLEARLTVRYPDTQSLVPGTIDDPYFPRAGEGGQWEVRHLQAETEAIATLAGLGFFGDEQGRFTLAGEPSILRFFAHGLPGLPADWTVEQTSRLQSASSTVEVVRPRFEVLGSGEDWLAFDYGFETSSGQLVSRAEVLQWLRSGRGPRQANGRKQVLDEESVLMLEPLLSELNVRQEHGHFVGPKAIAELVSEFRKNRSNSKISSNIDILESSLPATLDSSVPGMLRPYQRKGIAWLVDRLQRFGGALLADDMGLGKTLQTIAVLEQLFAEPNPAEGPALVIAPTSLLGNWRAEFQRFAPGRTIRVLHGSNRDAERGKVTPQDVVVTSYGTLARDLAWHLQREYKGIAVDEASLMRNPDTDHAKAIAKLRGRHRIALSGTPVENGVRDLWSIFRFIQPGWLGGREQFKEHYEVPLQATPVPKAPMERLRLKTAPFILRRTKEQVASDLPSKLIIDDYCELSADQRQIYRDLIGEGGKRVDEIREKAGTGAARLQMLTALLRLRQTCCDLGLLKNERLDKLPIERRSAKLERLLERVEEAISGNHRILVFSQFQTQLQKIREQLQARQIDTLLLDGQTRNRQDLVDRFQKPDGPPVFLISLKAGGYGLNLTAADTVIHFDPWWNPAAEAQATDRAHRIGQTRPVTVYRLLTRGTVEEKVVRLQATKRELAQAAFDESGLGEATGWSDKELTDLLRG
ncbi:MAG: SNF2-related protein [Luteolibacter sp.]